MPLQHIQWPGLLCLLALGLATGAGAQPPLPLEGTRWILTQLGDRRIDGAVPGREPHLELDGENRASGLTACNRFSGSYTLEGDDGLRFGPLTVTRMACLDGPPIEQRYLAALNATVNWEIAGRHLELYDEEGTRVARFEGKEKRIE